MHGLCSALLLSHYHAGEFRVFDIYLLFRYYYYTAAAFGGVKHYKYMTCLDDEVPGGVNI